MNDLDKLNIYYINLDKDIYKNKNIQNQFKKIGLKNYTRISGIHGKELSQKYIEKIGHPIYGNIAPKSAIGCAASHIKTWKHFLKKHPLHNGIKYSLIFEDDIKITEVNFLNILKIINKKLLHFTKKIDILHIGCNLNINHPAPTGIDTIALKYKIDHTQTLHFKIIKPFITLGLHGYLISNQCAQKLLHYFDKNGISGHIDLSIQFLINKLNLNTYTIVPNLVHQTSTTINTALSSNVIEFPTVLNTMVSNIYIDSEKKMSLKYLLTVCFAEIHSIGFRINIWTILILYIGIFYKKSFFGTEHHISLFFIIFLILPDICKSFETTQNLVQLLGSFLLFVSPSLIQFIFKHDVDFHNFL